MLASMFTHPAYYSGSYIQSASYVRSAWPAVLTSSYLAASPSESRMSIWYRQPVWSHDLRVGLLVRLVAGSYLVFTSNTDTGYHPNRWGIRSG